MPAPEPEPGMCGCFEIGFRYAHRDNCPKWGKSVRPRSELGKLQAENERLRGERDRAIATASKLALDVAERDSLIEQYKAEIKRLRATPTSQRE